MNTQSTRQQHHHYKASLSLQLCVSSGSNNLFILVVKEYLRASPSVIRTPPKPKSLLYKAYLFPWNFVHPYPTQTFPSTTYQPHSSQKLASNSRQNLTMSSQSSTAPTTAPTTTAPTTPPTPTRRQSMRAITPASTDPKFIRPSNDSRKALKVVMSSESDQPGPPSKKKAPIVLAAPNRNNPVEVDLEPSSDGVETLMDLTQDSDEENAKVTKKPRRKMKNGESELDDVGAFFHPPTFA
ncbi:hypothetical protein MJO29_015670, partial [Puccinia striiformis f. sp. tritici]